MRKTLRRIRPLATIVCSLALAGTCLAAPCMALAAQSTNTMGQQAAAAAEADFDTVVFGGVAITLPDGFSIMDSDVMLMGTSADGKIVVAITTVSDSIMGDGAIADAAQRSAELVGGTLSEKLEDATPAGTPLTGYGIQYMAAGEAHSMLLVFVPVGSSLTLVQIDVPSADSQALNAELTTIVSSIMPATELDATQTPVTDPTPTETVELGDTLEFGGLRVALPEGMSGRTSGTMATWQTDDGMFAVQVVANIAQDQGNSITDEQYDELAQVIAESTGGEILTKTIITDPSSGAVMHYYIMTLPISEDGSHFYVVTLGMVVVRDGSLSCLSTYIDSDALEQYGPVSDAVYENSSII